MERYLIVRDRSGKNPTALVAVEYSDSHVLIETFGRHGLAARYVSAVLQHIGWQAPVRRENVVFHRRRGMSGATDYTVGCVDHPTDTVAYNVVRNHVSMSGRVWRVRIPAPAAEILLDAIREDWGEPADVDVREFTPLPLKRDAKVYPRIPHED